MEPVHLAYLDYIYCNLSLSNVEMGIFPQFTRRGRDGSNTQWNSQVCKGLDCVWGLVPMWVAKRGTYTP